MRERITLISTTMHCFAVSHWAALPCAITFASCLPEMNWPCLSWERREAQGENFRVHRQVGELSANRQSWLQVDYCVPLAFKVGASARGLPSKMAVKTWEWVRVQRVKRKWQKTACYLHLCVFLCDVRFFRGGCQSTRKSWPSCKLRYGCPNALFAQLNCAGDEVGRESVMLLLTCLYTLAGADGRKGHCAQEEEGRP